MHPPGGTSGAGGLPVPDEPLGPGGQPPRAFSLLPFACLSNAANQPSVPVLPRFESSPLHSYEAAMSSRSRSRAAPSRRSWRASLIRKRGQVLGIVEAASRAAAEAVAVRRFELSEEQRKRLVVQEQG